MKFIRDRKDDYEERFFLNELVTASKNLGVLEAKIAAYEFDSILVPILNIKEAVSSMYIEGTQTTISDVLKSDVKPKPSNERITKEVNNHVRALLYGANHLHVSNFSHAFIQELHRIMLDGIIKESQNNTLGRYKIEDNHIENSYGKVVFTPPSYKETQKYMDELIRYMNDMSDDINPLIKAAIIHAQFESIHPFSDGNGRVGRLLVSLYLYKAKVISVPFFYISEAISEDKSVYYNMLTDSRSNNYNKWIKYLLSKIVVQSQKHIGYIDDLQRLYKKTKRIVRDKINSSKFDSIIEYIFTNPILKAEQLADRLSVSRGQAVRYLNILEENHVLQGDDKKRCRTFYFEELLHLAQRI